VAAEQLPRGEQQSKLSSQEIVLLQYVGCVSKAVNPEAALHVPLAQVFNGAQHQ
jgi:hypothetical protein